MGNDWKVKTVGDITVIRRFMWSSEAYTGQQHRRDHVIQTWSYLNLTGLRANIQLLHLSPECLDVTTCLFTSHPVATADLVKTKLKTTSCNSIIPLPIATQNTAILMSCNFPSSMGVIRQQEISSQAMSEGAKPRVTKLLMTTSQWKHAGLCVSGGGPQQWQGSLLLLRSGKPHFAYIKSSVNCWIMVAHWAPHSFTASTAGG